MMGRPLHWWGWLLCKGVTTAALVVCTTLVWHWLWFYYVPTADPKQDPALWAFLDGLSAADDTVPLLLTESTAAFHPITRWWLDNIKRLKPPVKNYAVVALDPTERDRLVALKERVIHNPALAMNWSRTHFRSPHYNTIVRYKWQIVVDVLRSGRTLLLSDTDIHWRRNPIPYLLSLPPCDLISGTDMRELPFNAQGTAIRFHPPFEGDGFHNWFNTGFMLLRPTPATIALAKRVLLRPMRGKDDQYILNTHLDALYRRNKRHSRTGHNESSCGNYGDLTFHLLRPDLFTHRLLYERYPVCRNYSILHFNFLGNYEEKIQYMRRHGFMEPGRAPRPPPPA
jgi:hypothetical protein